MSDSYILHDVMRKVKADGLFDSIRRDLIADLEQKSSYVDLKTSIESSMSTYLSEYQWSSALKKSDLREKARRHVESSNLIKDNLPTIVNQYMQTCQDQLVQPRLSAFVNDHIEQVYHSIGGTHIYRAPVKIDPPTPTPIVSLPPSPLPTVKPKSPVKKDVPSANPIKKPTNPPKDVTPVKKKAPVVPVKAEKRARNLSPIHSPTDLIDISPSPPSNSTPTAAAAAAPQPETISITSSPSPPPPVVRVASPLETNETRKLRPRRPHSKYSKDQFETDDVEMIEPEKTSPLETPSSPVVSPEYGTSPLIPPRSPSPVQTKSASPRRLRPRRNHDESDKTRKSSSSSNTADSQTIETVEISDDSSNSRSKSFIWKPKISK